MNSHKQRILDIIESTVANVQKNVEKINDLNVFPVPDGDTGSNMLSTLLSAWNNISDESDSDVEIFNDFARGALLGARGNSGVITSQIIKGFAVGVEKAGRLSHNREDLINIFKSAREYAYKSVSNPVEGTILSVVRELDENFGEEPKDIVEAFEIMLQIAKEATDRTPEQLPVLKEAGVVDSGAYGLVVMIEGALASLKGNKIILRVAETTQEVEVFSKADATKNIGYCTEFILTLKDPSNFPQEEFKKDLENLGGESIVMIVEEDILKVHVHAKRPGQVFNLAQHYGEFGKIKAENMASQATEAGHFVEEGEFRVNKNASKHLGVIAVSNGIGLDEEFKKLGADVIVSGGQTMNPSVEDFMNIISKMPNETIILLPNNSNIVLTAETVKKNVTDKNIVVFPTKSLQQGLVALSNIDKDMNVDDHMEEIIEHFQSINEGQITKAVRDAEMYGVAVKEGEYISIKDKKIIASNPNLLDTAKALIDSILEQGAEFISIIYNDNVTKEEREELVSYAESKSDDIEVEVVYGGQAVYNLLIYGDE